MKINSDGKHYTLVKTLNKPTDKEQLTNEIRTWDKAQRVTLKVDGAVSFEKFVELTDLLSANDIKNVGIITRKDNGK